MKKVFIPFCLLFVTFATGCVSTKVTSLVDNAYKDSSYSRILVVGNYDKIELTKSAEKHFVKELSDSGVFAIANSDLLPPLRKYSDSEITVIYAKYHLDACMIISQTGEKGETIYMPGWSNANASVDQGGYGGFHGTTATASVQSGGGDVKKKSYIDTRAELHDIKSGALVSRCESSSEQTNYENSPFTSSTDDLMQSISEKMVAEFGKNKLLRKK